MRDRSTLPIHFATARDRQEIYRLRHQVYARELRQHHENASATLTDALDGVNLYLVASRDDALVGFISLTPPNGHGYSIDKYSARHDMPFAFDGADACRRGCAGRLPRSAACRPRASCPGRDRQT